MGNGKFNYQRLPDKEYNKLLWKLKQGIGITLKDHFRMYGQDAEVVNAAAIITHLAEEFGMAVRGKPVDIDLPNWYRDRLDKYNADD
uniref:Uncharacterized protein n=1 Tax=viral metagenome TaxID=1070528 RepID=A0A6M3JBB5_9ZZZZ